MIMAENLEPPPTTSQAKLMWAGVLPSGRLLFDLFFQPQVLLALRGQHWSRPLRMIAALCLIGGLAMGISAIPSLWSGANQWGTWFQNHIHRVSIQDARLSWDSPTAEEMPYTTWHRGWQVKFQGADAEFPGDPISITAGKGLWFSPDNVYAWWRTGEDSVKKMPLLTEGKLFGTALFSTDRLWPEGLTLEGEELPAMGRTLVMWLIIPLLVTQILLFFVIIMFYSSLFAFIPVLMRSALSEEGFGNVYAVYLFAAIPPLLAAAIYGCLNIPFLDISTVFVICYVAYLFLSFHRYNKEQQANQEEGGR